jgi:hypothetical protein
MLHLLLYDSIGAFAMKGWSMAIISFAMYMSLSRYILWNSAIGRFSYNLSLNFYFV